MARHRRSLGRHWIAGGPWCTRPDSPRWSGASRSQSWTARTSRSRCRSDRTPPPNEQREIEREN